MYLAFNIQSNDQTLPIVRLSMLFTLKREHSIPFKYRINHKYSNRQMITPLVSLSCHTLRGGGEIILRRIRSLVKKSQTERIFHGSKSI